MGAVRSGLGIRIAPRSPQQPRGPLSLHSPSESQEARGLHAWAPGDDWLLPAAPGLAPGPPCTVCRTPGLLARLLGGGRGEFALSGRVCCVTVHRTLAAHYRVMFHSATSSPDGWDSEGRGEAGRPRCLPFAGLEAAAQVFPVSLGGSPRH